MSYIHRDIKPDNFRVDSNGKVYLIDFGSSEEFKEIMKVKTTSRYNVGSPFFSSIFVLCGEYAN